MEDSELDKDAMQVEQPDPDATQLVDPGAAPDIPPDDAPDVDPGDALGVDSDATVLADSDATHLVDDEATRRVDPDATQLAEPSTPEGGSDDDVQDELPTIVVPHAVSAGQEGPDGIDAMDDPYAPINDADFHACDPIRTRCH
jgi:serine/threonine-protein kinase